MTAKTDDMNALRLLYVGHEEFKYIESDLIAIDTKGMADEPLRIIFCQKPTAYNFFRYCCLLAIMNMDNSEVALYQL